MHGGYIYLPTAVFLSLVVAYLALPRFIDLLLSS